MFPLYIKDIPSFSDSKKVIKKMMKLYEIQDQPWFPGIAKHRGPLYDNDCLRFLVLFLSCFCLVIPGGVADLLTTIRCCS